MGSTGSGRFTDYTKSKGAGQEKAGGSGAGGGGSSGTDRCEQAFSCTLEEVAQCEYYEQMGGLPPEESELRIFVRGRVVAVDDKNRIIGALPTQFNYIAACIVDGYEYIGIVRATSKHPLPTVIADFMKK